MFRESVFFGKLSDKSIQLQNSSSKSKQMFTSWRLCTFFTRMLLKLYCFTLVMTQLVVLNTAAGRPGSSHPWCRRCSTPSRPCRALSPPARSWRRRRWPRSGRRPPPRSCRRRRRRSRPWRCSRRSDPPRRRRSDWRRPGWVSLRQSGQQNQVDQSEQSCVEITHDVALVVLSYKRSLQQIKSF